MRRSHQLAALARRADHRHRARQLRAGRQGSCERYGGARRPVRQPPCHADLGVPSQQHPRLRPHGHRPAAIAKLSDAIAAPKPYPANADYFCPLDLGLFYHLTFTRADGTQVTGEAKPDGCEYADLSSGPRGAIVDFDTFWSLFAAALGVAPSALHYQP